MGKQLSSLEGVRLLVVEDDPDSRDLLTYMFEGDGVKMAIASSAAEALEVLTRFKPDILISDILLPGEDGYSLLLKIRQLEAERGRQLPAIALSACAREEDRTHALSVGFDRYLSKPFDLDDLTAAITSLVKQEEADKL